MSEEKESTKLVCADCGYEGLFQGVHSASYCAHLGWSAEGDERFCPTCTTAREARCVHCGCKERTGYHEPACPVRVKAETKSKHPADTQLLIAEECDQIKAMLLEKNKAYGNSFAEPLRIFSKAAMDEQINVRLDDKLSRLARGAAAGEDVELDLMGYLVLKRVLRKLERL